MATPPPGTSGISLQGGTVDREGAKAVADSIVAIFQAANTEGMEQKTVRHALSILSQLSVVQNINIDRNTVSMSPPMPNKFIVSTDYET